MPIESKRARWWFARLLRVPPRVFGALRVCAYLCVVTAVLGWIAARSAYGHVGEAALVLGRELAGFEDLTGSAYRVRLNGQATNIASALTEMPVEEVLDRLERACKTGSATAELEGLGAALPAPFAELDARAVRGVLRQDGRRDGMVACLVASPEAARSSLAGRLERFAETLDLADVGLLRYAYARTLPSGRTHVLVSWTDGAFDLAALAGGTDRDAPGSDVSGAARPRQSVRILTAEIEGAPHGTRIYESSLEPGAVLALLAKDMKERGFAPIGAIERQVPHGRAFSRDGLDVLVFAFEGGADKSVVSMVTTSAGASGRRHTMTVR